MLSQSDRGGGRGRFATATAAVLMLLLLVACSSGQAGSTSTTGIPSPPAIPAAPPVPSPAVPGPVTADALAEPLAESEPLSAQIPAIGLATGRLVHLGLTADRALEVPGDAITAGWFTLSPTPGEIGPSVIAGHVNYASVPGVFARLHEMRSGDTVTIDRADGTSAVFTTYRVDRYPKSAFPTEQVYGNTETPELRLITCGGSFDRGAGEYRDNVVVFANLTSTYRR